MEIVKVNILGPFPCSDKGNRFVLVTLDYFTKWPEAYILPDQEAETVAEAGGVLQPLWGPPRASF